MITNLLQVAAFQTLAFQLMLGEADQLAYELKLPVPHPIEDRYVVDAFVGPPQYGVGGSIQTRNVAFTFSEGRLHTITRTDLYPPLNMSKRTIESLPPASALTAETAYQLATQCLWAISLDVSALERQFRPTVTQQLYNAQPSGRIAAGTGERVPAGQEPIQKPVVTFKVVWDNGSLKELERPPVTVRLLGNTKELMDLQLAERSHLRRPMVVITNAAYWGVKTNLAMLFEKREVTTNRTVTPGDWKYPRWAPPRDLPEAQLQDFMAKFFGGPAAVQTLTRPERVNAYRIKEYDPILERRGEMNSLMKDFKTVAEYPMGRGPLPIKLELAEQLGAILADAFSYDWRWRPNYDDPVYHKKGIPYGLRLQFIRQTNVVDVVFASDNSALIFYGPMRRTPEMSFEPKREQVSKLLKQMLP